MLSSSTHLKPQGRPASPQSTASTLSNITVVDAAVQPTDSSITASSTPPTSQSDSQSVHEDAPNHTDPSAPRRHSSRRRSTVATYNDKENAGTRIHTPAKYRKDTPLQPQPPHHTTTPDEAEQVKQVEQAEQAKQAEQVEQVEPVEQVEHAEQRQQTEEPEPPTPADEPMHRRQSGRARNSIVTYNDKENAGTRIHTPTKYIDGTYIRKTLHDPIPGIPQPQSQSPPSANNLSKHSLKRRASGLRTELRADSSDEESETDAQSAPRRKPLRLGDRSSKHTQTLASQLGKRGREAFEAAKSKAGASTKKGADKTDGTANKRQKKTIIRRAISSPIPSPPPQPPARPVLNYGPPGKPWLYHGKFHNTGQDDLVGKLSIIVGHKPKAGEESVRQNSVLPLPMFMMAEKLDLYPKKKVPESKRPFEPFQMPYDVFCPLPKEAKVKDWRELKKNEYKGEDAQEIKQRAKEQSKKQRNMEASTCNCIGSCERDSCFNATLFFECDDRSCNLGLDCGNRQFTNLQRRYKDDRRQGKYFKSFNVGVEVVSTEDRGHGVRAMRPFESDQIVIEYIGEIITQQESDRRVNEIYKDHKCFYLMNFYDKLIIDGYRGNIARFVNHSCDPNCRMEKWTVNGEQRMALFANRFIMTGEELTWHYNFESYGQEQPCYCGSWNCAGVIGRQVRNKPNKEPAGSKRKSPDEFEDRQKKKQKVNRLVQAASSTGRTLLSKTKESLKGLVETVSAAASAPSVETKKSRDERAARRSLAIAQDSSDDETPEPSRNGMSTRSTRQTHSPPKKALAQNATSKLQAEESSRRSSLKASKATAALPARSRSVPARTSTRSTRAISTPEDDNEDDDSEEELELESELEPEPQITTTARKTPPIPARKVPKRKSPLSLRRMSMAARKTSTITTRKSTGSFMVPESAEEDTSSETPAASTASKSTTSVGGKRAPSIADTDSISTLSTVASSAASTTTSSMGTATTTVPPTGPFSSAKKSTPAATNLKQSRLSFLPGALGFQKQNDMFGSVATKVAKKPPSRSTGMR